MKSEESAGIRIQDVGIDENRKPPSCCVCLNVRLGTIVISLFYMFCGIFVAAQTLRHKKKEYAGTVVVDEFDDWSYLNHFQNNGHKYAVDRNCVGLVILCMSVIVMILCIYGASLRRSSYVLPFFCLQVFDMSLTIMIAATMLSYASRLKWFMENSGKYDEHIANMSLTHFRMLLVTFWLITITIKYYMMSVVWECYKYTKGIEDQHRRMDVNPSFMIYPGALGVDGMVLPTYDDVVKASPPPAYTQSQ